MESRNKETVKASDDVIDYDAISRRVVVTRILAIDDVAISPKALDRILGVIQNIPCNAMMIRE